MSESQSRYSIVERLTKQKLDIMSAKFKLDEEIKETEYTLETMEQNIQFKVKAIRDSADEQVRCVGEEVETIRNKATYLKTRLAEKKAMFDEKIESINDALKRIEDIGKTSQS